MSNPHDETEALPVVDELKNIVDRAGRSDLEVLPWPPKFLDAEDAGDLMNRL